MEAVSRAFHHTRFRPDQTKHHLCLGPCQVPQEEPHNHPRPLPSSRRTKEHVRQATFLQILQHADHLSSWLYYWSTGHCPLIGALWASLHLPRLQFHLLSIHYWLRLVSPHKKSEELLWRYLLSGLFSVLSLGLLWVVSLRQE